MGLDMMLYGDDGSDAVEIAYWRKHPDLHGYIVSEFAGGVDECQRIDLSASNLDQILQAVKDKNLPHTEGFFFGTSSSEDDPHTVELLLDAKTWMHKHPNGKVFYQASW